jgi:phosphoribosyl-AMP cyclohydrolase / phosphoribosyl-ATP pyrophosphohydrolase
VSLALDLDALDFDKGAGFLTVVAVDAVDGAVLMVAHADRAALESTLATGEMHYRSRTRGAWHKGETSGNVQRVLSLVPDCDGDAILALVTPAGPACHTGASSCFEDTAAAPGVLGRLDELIERRATEPPGPASSYVRALLDDRNLRLKKLGEETTELAIAATGEDTGAIASEAADLLFHVLVAVRASGISLHDVLEVLVQRERHD